MRLHRLKYRLARLVKYGVVLAILGGVGMFAAMEYTARPKFCSSCHNMKPYYESWKASSHKNVPCTDCHYEPGLLETFEGKFKALSQVAKYVTATEGTKPWAEVSDFSCMRSGCHSKRLLTGRIKFGRVYFDHRHHLTELRRGKKLRCTSCHSQVMVGSHMQVTKSTCFQCHFHKSKQTATHEDCNTCHGPPQEVIQVAGRPFRHKEYTDRGIACRNCHSRITKGTGAVPKPRCRTCHNAANHLAKYKDVDFLHTFHVTKHKVECFNCHSEILHQLEPLPHKRQSSCEPCHTDKHSKQLLVYMGRGGKDIKPQPSRMFQTRVGCDGCHSCLPGAKPRGGGSAGHFCVAKSATCIHCHGKTFAGMLGRLQQRVTADTSRLRQDLTTVRERLKTAGEDGVKTRLEGLLATAAYNLGLVSDDGSGGMHNPAYIRGMLTDAETKLTEARKALKMTVTAPPQVASAGSWGCTTACHVGIEKRAIGVRGTRFSHARHATRSELTCQSCHTRKPHGKTKPKATSCASSCHHDDKKAKCESCHTAQGPFLRGTVADGRNLTYKPDPMAKQVQCTGCHAKIRTGHRLQDVKKTCIDCHEKGYEAQVDEWKTDTANGSASVAALLETARSVARFCPDTPLEASLTRAAKSLDLVRQSGGVHNVDLARKLLRQSVDELTKALESAGCTPSAKLPPPPPPRP
ncbi:MAG: NapC/NirT family cytochrome c [bacterium]